ncbi:MAG: TatD family hydrolase [Alloprevotella sp.]|nr:TatD family hydrolase [Alloprevotella sp.]
MDFHTHNLAATPGTAIVNLPQEALLHPDAFTPHPAGLYSVGIHPWWTGEENLVHLWAGARALAALPQVVAIGECGFDRLRGASPDVQREVFSRHVRLSEELRKPLTIHCVRAFDLLLAARRELRPEMKWTIHGFRGRPALARQLLNAGFDLSFGFRHNPESFRLTPPGRRHVETDENY